MKHRISNINKQFWKKAISNRATSFGDNKKNGLIIYSFLFHHSHLRKAYSEIYYLTGLTLIITTFYVFFLVLLVTSNCVCFTFVTLRKKIKFCTEDFFRKRRIWPHVLKKILIGNLQFLCSVIWANCLQLTNNGEINIMNNISFCSRLIRHKLSGTWFLM